MWATDEKQIIIAFADPSWYSEWPRVLPQLEPEKGL